MRKALQSLFFVAFVVLFYASYAGAQTLTSDGLQGMNWANPTDNANGAAWPSGMTGTETYAQAVIEGQTVGNAVKKAGGKTVRMPITSALANSTNWPIYMGAIDGINSTGMKVILCFWAYNTHHVADINAWYTMWDTVNASYGNTMMVRYEPINEPDDYNASDLDNLYAGFISRYSPPARKCILDGTGYAQNVVPVGSDSRLSSQLLGLHSYHWYWGSSSSWKTDYNAMATAVGSYAARTVVTEIGVQTEGRSPSVEFWQQWGTDLQPDQALLTGGLDWARVNNVATIAWSGIDDPDLYHWFYAFSNLTEANTEVANMFRWSWSAGYNGQSLTPPMGWSSWNHFGCGGLNETAVKQQASAMASNGMKAAGYSYVNLDDCWMASNRDSNGNLVPDPTNFPSGMPALVSYVHNLGLKIGLYEDVGTETCDGRPGSYGYYAQDAATFANWGIDYIKMDWCSNTGLDPQTQYTQFSQALTAANANVVFSICDWGTKQPWTWASAVGNSWRTTPDISNNWLSMINNLEATSALASAAGPGAWNDPDMLEVGNGGMSDTEDLTHFVMWSMLAAPLIAGNDLTNMSAASLATLTNSGVIAIDQDVVGTPGILLSDNGSGLQIWERQVVGGTVVALLNKSAATATITVNWSDLGLDPSQSVDVNDILNQVDLGAYASSFSSAVSSHGVTLLKLATSATVPTQTIYEADASANVVSGGAVIEPCSYEWGYSCLDGNEAGYIGNTGTITLNDVNAATAGTYYMTIYGMVNGTRTYDVSVNGVAASQVSLTGTSFAIPSAAGTTVQLNEGENSLELSNSSGWTPDLDHIVLSLQGTQTSNFNIAYPIQNVTVSSGQTATASLTLVPTGGFAGTVSVSCTLLAEMVGATCSSATASLSGGNSATVSLTISTVAAQTAAQTAQDKTRKASLQPRSSTTKRPASKLFYASVFPISALTLIGIGASFRFPRKNRWMILLFFALVSAGILQTVACGGGSANSVATCSAVPNAPTGLSAASTSSTGTTLSWTAASAGSNCTVSSYSVYQNNKLIGTTSNPTYAVTGLSPATTYSFYVVANDAAGASSSSSAVSVTTGSTVTPSGTYNVTVTATSGSISQSSEFQVIVQ